MEIFRPKQIKLVEIYDLGDIARDCSEYTDKDDLIPFQITYTILSPPDWDLRGYPLHLKELKQFMFEDSNSTYQYFGKDDRYRGVFEKTVDKNGGVIRRRKVYNFQKPLDRIQAVNFEEWDADILKLLNKLPCHVTDVLGNYLKRNAIS